MWMWGATMSNGRHLVVTLSTVGKQLELDSVTTKVLGSQVLVLIWERACLEAARHSTEVAKCQISGALNQAVTHVTTCIANHTRVSVHDEGATAALKRSTTLLVCVGRRTIVGGLVVLPVRVGSTSLEDLERTQTLEDVALLQVLLAALAERTVAEVSGGIVNATRVAVHDEVATSDEAEVTATASEAGALRLRREGLGAIVGGLVALPVLTVTSSNGGDESGNEDGGGELHVEDVD